MEAHDASALMSSDNLVGVVSANITSGGFGFRNAAGLNIDAVGLDGPGITAFTGNNVSAIGGVALWSNGLLQLKQNVSGNNVLLRSDTKAVMENGGSVQPAIGAGGLRVEAHDASTLTSTNNLVGAVSTDVTAGSFAFRNSSGSVGAGEALGAFTVGAGQIVLNGDIRTDGGGAVDFRGVNNVLLGTNVSIFTDAAGGATNGGAVLFAPTTTIQALGTQATLTVNTNADGGGRRARCSREFWTRASPSTVRREEPMR